MFILACVLAAVGIIALLGSIIVKQRLGKLIGAIVMLLSLIPLGIATTYTQGIGEAKVLRSWTGEVIGQDTTPGFDLKSPMTKLVDFDIRNQVASYIGDGTTDNNGGEPTGPQITVSDADRVMNNIDLVVRYSILPEKVSDIYREHQSQEVFRTRIIEQDIRSVTRTVPGKYTTQDLMGNRAQVEADLLAALEERWAGQGVVVESVALQEVRPPKEVLQRFADAQAARAQVAKEQALLESATVAAQQKVVAAEAEAKANNVLTKSLTPEVLKQRELDTLRAIGDKGNLVVVPQGSTPFVNIEKASK